MTHWLDTYYGRGRSMGTGDKIPNATSPGMDRNLYIAMHLLQSNGFPTSVIRYCLAQMLHESNSFTSRISKVWNWAGLTLSDWAKNNVDAFDAGNGYAGYRTMDGFAKDYKRVLSLAPGRPIDAKTAQQFLDGLVANKYFQASPTAYAQAMNRNFKVVDAYLAKINDPKSDISKDVANQDKRNVAWNDRNNLFKGSLIDWMKQHPIITGAILAAGGLVVVKVISK